MSSSIENPIDWAPVGSVSKRQVQSEKSYLEHNMALQICKKSVDTYYNILTQNTLTKSVVIRGDLGSGNTLCILYTALYSISKGFIQPAQQICDIVH